MKVCQPSENLTSLKKLILQLQLTLELSQIQEIASIYNDLLILFAEYSFVFENNSEERQSLKSTCTKSEGSLSTQDPARDGTNWYGYAGQNPVTFKDSLGLFAYGPDGQQYSTLDNQATQNPSNVTKFFNGVEVGIYNSFRSLSNLDFGMDCGQNAFQSFENGDILQGILWEIYGVTEVALDLYLAMTGAGVFGARVASAETLFTTGSLTAAYISWQYSLQNNLGIVNSTLQNGWNIFSQNMELLGKDILSSEASTAKTISSLPANEGYSLFRKLKKAIGSAGEGKDWHNIVEQSQIKRSGFSPELIHNTDNIIAIDHATHMKITGY